MSLFLKFKYLDFIGTEYIIQKVKRYVKKQISKSAGSNIKVDCSLDPSSSNPVENREVTRALDGKLNGEQYTNEGGYITAYIHGDALTFGKNGTRANYCSTAFGDCCMALGEGSHAEGTSTQAIGDNSHAEGSKTNARGTCSHAEGRYTEASGDYSHAEGYGSHASGYYSHAEGSNTYAFGDYSHAEGSNTYARGKCQHVSGKFNIDDTDGIYAFIIGNGTAHSARSNAFAIEWEGNIVLFDNGTPVVLTPAKLSALLALVS